MTSDEQPPAAGPVPDEPAAPVAPAAVVARPARRSIVLSWVLGLVIVALLAGLLGGAAALVAGLTSSGDWGGLVAALIGFTVAVGVAGVGWLVLVLLTVQRRVPAGRRTRVTAISVGAVALTLAVGYGLSQVSGVGSGASALVVGAVALIGALLPPELVSREERRAALAVEAPQAPLAPQAEADRPE